MHGLKNVQVVIAKGRAYNYHRPTRTRLPDDPSSPEFVARVVDLNRQLEGPDGDALRQKESRRLSYIDDAIDDAFRRAERRARDSDIPYSITPACIRAMKRRAKRRCEVTGIPFSIKKEHSGYHNPYGPSLDRIAPPLGYTKKNCRLVLVSVNVAINAFGLEHFLEIARAAVGRHDNE